MFSIHFNDNHSPVTSVSVTLFCVACFLSRSVFVSVKITAVVFSNVCVNYSGVAERSSGRLAPWLAVLKVLRHTRCCCGSIDRETERQTDRQTQRDCVQYIIRRKTIILVNNLLIHLRRFYSHSAIGISRNLLPKCFTPIQSVAFLLFLYPSFIPYLGSAISFPHPVAKNDTCSHLVWRSG